MMPKQCFYINIKINFVEIIRSVYFHWNCIKAFIDCQPFKSFKQKMVYWWVKSTEFCNLVSLCYFIINIFRTEEIQYLKRATRKDFSFEGSFQEAIGSILAMAQCFGIMPVVGIKCKSASHLKFKWKSMRTIYSLIAISLALIYASITLWITLNNEIQFVQMSKFRFFVKCRILYQMHFSIYLQFH